MWSGWGFLHYVVLWPFDLWFRKVGFVAVPLTVGLGHRLLKTEPFGRRIFIGLIVQISFVRVHAHTHEHIRQLNQNQC